MPAGHQPTQGGIKGVSERGKAQTERDILCHVGSHTFYTTTDRLCDTKAIRSHVLTDLGSAN